MPQNPMWSIVGRIFGGGPWAPLPLDPVTGALVTTPPVVETEIVTNQQAPSATATPLGSGALNTGVLIKAYPNNTGIIYVGAAGITSANGYPLSPGDYVTISATDLSQVFQFGTVPSTDRLAYIGT